MRVLITGGAGFIGHHLANKCLQQNWTTDIVDDLSAGDRSLVPKEAEFFKADFATSGTQLPRLKNKLYDVVFHLAAKPRVSYSVEHPFETHQVNVTKTLQLLELCRNNVKRFVFASSSAVYGNYVSLPTNEFASKHPNSPYGLQKLIIEEYLKLYSELYHLDTVSLRLFNVYGPGQKGDSPYATAVAAWTDAIRNNKPLRSDGDGSQTRDLTHVEDVTDVMIAVAKRETKFSGQVMNIGSGAKIANKEILNFLQQKYPLIKVQSAPKRPGDVQATLADIRVAKQEINYQPKMNFWESLINILER